MVECLVYYVEVIKNTQVARVALHLWGSDEVKLEIFRTSIK